MSTPKRPQPTGYFPAQHAKPAPHQHSLKPGVAQPKIAPHAPAQRKPAAPPVYRPQPVPKVLQTKAAVNRQPQAAPSRQTPVAPPVYRPQPAPAVMQAKMIAQRQQPQQPTQPPKAPPVYRPQQAAKAVQPKAGIVRPPSPVQSQARPLASPAHGRKVVQARPQPKPAAAKVQTPARPNNHSPQGVVQAHFKIPRSRVFANAPHGAVQRPYAYMGGGASFSAQVGSDTGNRFLTAGNAADVQKTTRVALRVSDDCEMAIEETNLTGVQPKSFYATPSVINEGNQGLAETQSRYGIRAASPAKTLTVVDADGNKHKQVQVKAYVRATNLKLATGEQNCNNFAGHLSGKGAQLLIPQLSDQSPQEAPRWSAFNQGHYALGQYVAQQLTYLPLRDMMPLTTVNDFLDDIQRDPIGPNAVGNRIGQNYAEALADRRARGLVRRLGINEAASPRPGDAFVIHTLASQDANQNITDVRTRRAFVPKWPYHWAGVVAESGTDRVTLENYARHDPHGTGPNTAQDPRWYFQMYGQGLGQSFHEANEATQEYANPITLAVRNPNRLPPPTFWDSLAKSAKETFGL